MYSNDDTNSNISHRVFQIELDFYFILLWLNATKKDINLISNYH